MNQTLIASKPIARGSILLMLLLLSISSTRAGSATWSASPVSNNWNTSANWTPATIPDGPGDIATFEVSNTINLTFSALTEVSGLTFNTGASAYTFNVIPPVTLTISGAGIVNQSGVTQNFLVRDHAGKRGLLSFTNSATAGDGVIITNHGSSEFGIVATTEFHDTANAGTSSIINLAPIHSFSGGGVTNFFDQSSAANATVESKGPLVDILDGFESETNFYDSSTADHATLIADGGVFADSTGVIEFWDQATAANAVITITASEERGAVGFNNDSTAANSRITSGGFLTFADNSSAANANIVLKDDGSGGSLTYFSGNSTGGTATLHILGESVLDLQSHATPGLSVGSIEGDGTIQLGQLNLTTGSNNKNTTFSGLLEDQNSKGSLMKTGNGTLTLSGANTYEGGTTISAGTLLVANTTGSATGTGFVQVNSEILGGRGIISGAVTIGTGSGSGAYLAPAAGSNGHPTLTIQSQLTLKADATYTDTFVVWGNRSRVDAVVANGVTILSATIALEGIAQGEIATGTVLTLISNISTNPITGTFSNLSEGEIVVVDGRSFQASYHGGDGNDLTLTVLE